MSNVEVKKLILPGVKYDLLDIFLQWNPGRVQICYSNYLVFLIMFLAICFMQVHLFLVFFVCLCEIRISGEWNFYFRGSNHWRKLYYFVHSCGLGWGYVVSFFFIPFVSRLLFFPLFLPVWLLVFCVWGVCVLFGVFWGHVGHVDILRHKYHCTVTSLDGKLYLRLTKQICSVGMQMVSIFFHMRCTLFLLLPSFSCLILSLLVCMQWNWDDGFGLKAMQLRWSLLFSCPNCNRSFYVIGLLILYNNPQKKKKKKKKLHS